MPWVASTKWVMGLQCAIAHLLSGSEELRSCFTLLGTAVPLCQLTSSLATVGPIAVVAWLLPTGTTGRRHLTRPLLVKWSEYTGAASTRSTVHVQV
jgi:hypothetical protein